VKTGITCITMTNWEGRPLRGIFIRIKGSRKQTMLRGEAILMIVTVGYVKILTNCRSREK
jgi:hypothetical protein